MGGVVPRDFFLRQDREENEGNDRFVDIVNEKVKLDPEYIKYFFFGKWVLTEEKLSILFEQRDEDYENEEVKSKVIEKLDFPIHKESKKRYEKFLN